MICMLKLNATVWQQKLNTEARTCAQNGTEKDSQERLKMDSSRQKETGKAKSDPEKNLWGRLKKDRTDMGREKQKRDIHGGKAVVALSWMDRSNQRRRKIIIKNLYMLQKGEKKR